MNVIIPLLGTASAAAAAFAFAHRKLTRHHMLEEQYKQIRDAAARLWVASKHPVTILVLGFQNHGRSSFVNTMFRVLYKEEGPLIMRAETGPTKNTTTARRVLRVKNKLMGLYPKYLMNLIDTPCSSTSDDINDDALRNLLRGGGIEDQISENDPSKQRNVRTVPECVILVMKAEDCHIGGPAWDRLPALVKILRAEGLQFVVVLTHRNEARKASIDLGDLTRRVAARAGTDFVHCIENYVVDHHDGKNSSNVSNDFDTHNQTLSIVRQCFEYVRQHRQLKRKRMGKLHGAGDDQVSYDSSASD
jgi:hypothetical protein